MSENSIIYNHVSIGHNLRGKVILNVSCDYKDILQQIYEIVAKWECNHSIDIYIEDISILINKSFLLSLSKLQTTKNESLRINIYTNDILYLKQLRKKYGIVLNKCEDLNDYFKETIIIDNIYDEEILYDNIITFFNSVYEKNNSASGLQNSNITNNDASLKLDIYYYVQDPVSILFNKFILQIRDDNADNYVKKTVKSIRKIYETDTVDIIEVLVNNFNNSIDRRELSVDSSNSITNYETYINQFIDTIKQLINNNSHKIQSRYQISISIDDKAYDRIRENLLKLYNTLDKHHRNDLIKLGINTGFDTLALMLQIWTISQSGVLEYSLQGVFVKPIKTLYKSTKSIYTDTMNLIYSKDIAHYLEELITNNMIFMECIAQLSTDLLLLMSYSTGVHGLCILGDIGQKNKENRYMLFTNVNNSYSTISTNLCILKIEQNSDIEYTDNYVRSIEENPNKNNAYIYFNNKNSSDNKSIRTQNMFEGHIKSMKYMLYAETPLYFIPYMDLLLKNNFNMNKILDQSAITSKALDIIVLSSSPYKWQESLLKQQLNDSYNAVPIRYVASQQENKYLDDYSSYDIALRTDAVNDFPISKIYFLTIYHRYSINYIDNLFTGILSSLHYFIGNRVKLYGDEHKEKYKILVKYCRLMGELKIRLSKLNNENLSDEAHYIIDYIEVFKVNLSNIYYITNFNNLKLKEKYEEKIKIIHKNLFESIHILSSVRKYFFSSIEVKDIDKYRNNYKKIITHYIDQMKKKDPFVGVDLKNINSSSSIYISKHREKLCFNNTNDIISYINKAFLSTKSLLLTDLRVEVYKLHLGLNNTLDELLTIINSERMYHDAMNYTLCYKVGQLVSNNITSIISDIKYSTELLQLFKTVLLLNIGVTQEFVNKYLNDDLVEKLYNIVLGTYLITQLHNYLYASDSPFRNNDNTRNYCINILEMIHLEELSIFIHYIKHINQYEYFQGTTSYKQLSLCDEDNIIQELDKINEQLHSKIFVNIYDNYDIESTNNVETYTINRGIVSQTGSNNSYTIDLKNINVNYKRLTTYLSNIYYETLRIKLNNSDFFYKNMFKNVVFHKELIDFTKSKSIDSLLDDGGSILSDFIDGNFGTGSIINKNHINILVDNFLNIGNIQESIINKDLIETFKDYFHILSKYTLDKTLKTISKENLEDYNNYIKYLYLRSDKMAPLANINNGDIIIPGKVQNNYMIFDNSHSVFGGSSLDMTSFVDTESIYASVSDGEISRNLFFSRIEELILPLSSHNELISIVFDIINTIDLYQVSANIRKKKLKKMIRKRLDNTNTNNAVKEYSKLLANYGIVELFKKNYESLFNINKDEKNNIVLTEKQRAEEYSVFAKCLHNIARHNTRNIYIQDIGNVINWKFIYKEEDNKANKKELCLRGKQKKVKHIAYLGSLALFPIEDSKLYLNDRIKQIGENEIIIKGV